MGLGHRLTRWAGVLAGSLAASYVLGLHLPNALILLMFGILNLLDTSYAAEGQPLQHRLLECAIRPAWCDPWSRGPPASAGRMMPSDGSPCIRLSSSSELPFHSTEINSPVSGTRSATGKMTAGIIPHNELQRMSAVRRYDVLDTPPDGFFDRITAMAARRFKVPIAIISIVDTDRIWFKSHHGLAVEQIGRDAGLCASAILSAAPHILTDARLDPRSLANPLVAGEFGLRFYVGVPLTTSDGFNLGTLCVINQTPQPVEQEQLDDLLDLASVVMDQLELRLSARRAVAHSQLMAREVDHRVMNSLQFVSSMLTMQSRLPNSADASESLRAAANRVTAVAQVHRNFYIDDTADTSCIAFLRRLCGDLANILGRQIEVTGDEGRVPTTLIQPIGLMVNELVTNAAKHGAGAIRVAYGRRDGVDELSVSDEGLGLPFDYDLSKSHGLGMKVLMSLVTQLGGRIVACNREWTTGACYTVTIPTVLTS